MWYLDPKQGISYLERESGEREKKRDIGLDRSKLGTATGNFLSGKREGERDRLD